MYHHTRVNFSPPENTKLFQKYKYCSNFIVSGTCKLRDSPVGQINLGDYEAQYKKRTPSLKNAFEIVVRGT